MDNLNDFYSYTHKDRSVTTIEQFISTNNLLSIGRDLDKEELLNYPGNSSTSNKERILKEYSKEELAEYNKSNQLTLLKIGTILLIPYSKINREAIFGENNALLTEEFETFLADKYEELATDSAYFPVSRLNFTGKYIGINKKLFPNFTVWLWSRALTENTSDEEAKGQLIDLTPFISELTTSVNQGGTFSFNLAPLIGEYDISRGWQIKEDSLLSFKQNNGKDFNFVSKGDLLKRVKGNFQKNDFYFERIIRENDLVFIRFETLQNEIKERLNEKKYNKDFTIPYTELQNKIYDMIGLVDKCLPSTDFEGNSVSISVQGRDLNKVLIEDGCIFTPLDFLPGKSFTFSEQDKRLEKRINGRLANLGTYLDRTIHYSLQFVINALSNMGVVPGEIFDGYKYSVRKKEDGSFIDSDGRTYITRDYGKDKPEIIKEKAEGVWQIIKLVVDDDLKNRRVVDQSLANESGSILNHIKKVCQEPLVEFFTDTYKDQFYLIARKPPYTYNKIKEWNNKGLILKIPTEDCLSDSLTFSDSVAYSMYRLLPSTGMNQDYIKVWLKAKYFPKLARIFGFKFLDIQTNYVPNIPPINSARNIPVLEIVKQGIYDLRELIEQNMYLPFSREGQIIINGDRRIKAKTWIEYELTGEIFYVEGVSNSIVKGDKIDRKTILQVNRGLVKKDLDVYFDLINLYLDPSIMNNPNLSYEDFIKNTSDTWEVNDEALRYLMQNRQFNNRSSYISKIKPKSPTLLKAQLKPQEIITK